MKEPRLRDYVKWTDKEHSSYTSWKLEGREWDLPPGLRWEPASDDNFIDSYVKGLPFAPGQTRHPWEGPEEWHVTHTWGMLRNRLRRNDPPRPEHLAHMVRHYPIPEDLRGYVADIIEGKLKRRRGPARYNRQLLDAWAVWSYRVLRWKKVYERQNARRPAGMYGVDPYRAALEKVAKESGISEHTLDSWLYPRS